MFIIYMFLYNCHSATIVIFASIFLVILFFNYHFMNKIIFKIKYLTRWSIAHFCLYFIFGSLCPNHFTEFMILGILWEIIIKIGSLLLNTTWIKNGTKGQLSLLIMNIMGYQFSQLFFSIFHI